MVVVVPLLSHFLFAAFVSFYAVVLLRMSEIFIVTFSAVKLFFRVISDHGVIR